MSWFVFKLNLQPEILDIYSTDMEALVEQIIPLHFARIIKDRKVDDKYIELFLPQQTSEDAISDFNDLTGLTDKLLHEYSEILDSFEENNGINYSQDFLDENEQCGVLRRKLENEFPLLKKSYEKYSDDEIDARYELKLNFHVGTGITHIRKFYKIKAYLEDEGAENIFVANPERMFYNVENERIIICSKNQETAIRNANQLENYINSKRDFYSDLGKITINPICKEIRIIGKMSQITYVVVYPNGNPSADRWDILSASGAKSQETTLLGADGKPLKKKQIEDELSKHSKKGYLRSVSIKGVGAKMISYVKSIADPFKK